jgi:hypothetical protein
MGRLWRVLPDFAFDALARFWGKSPGSCVMNFRFSAVVEGIPHELDLPAVAPAPFAESEVNPKTELLPPGKLSVKLVGLQSHGLFARWRKLTQPNHQTFERILHLSISRSRLQNLTGNIQRIRHSPVNALRRN